MGKNKVSYVYIMFNRKNGVLYTGVTSDIVRRVWEHKNELNNGFTKRYNVNKLGYYEQYSNIEDAITREKQIKGGSRQKKLDLIESVNPEWQDLFDNIV